MGTESTNKTDYSFSLTFNLSSAVIVATMFVLTSFVVIGTVLGEWKGVADKLSDLAIGLIIVFIGVPIAMKINRQNRAEEHRDVTKAFCLMMHRYLQQAVSRIDTTTFFLVHDHKPTYAPTREIFEQPEWQKRLVLINDPDLVSKMEWVKDHIDSYLGFLDATKDDSEMKGTVLRMIVEWSIGLNRYSELKELSKSNNGSLPVAQFFTNEGLNRKIISLIDLLEDYMRRAGFEFTDWDSERINLVRDMNARA